MAVNKWAWISLGLLCWAVVATALVGHYWYLYGTYKVLYEEARGQLEALTVRVNVLIDYGNGTRIWFNDTLASAGYTVFDVLCLIANVDYVAYSGPTWVGYPNNTAYFVMGINGVYMNATHAWFWWYWDPTTREWVLPPYGANHVNATVVDGGIYAWVYESYASWPPPPP